MITRRCLSAQKSHNYGNNHKNKTLSLHAICRYMWRLISEEKGLLIHWSRVRIPQALLVFLIATQIRSPADHRVSTYKNVPCVGAQSKVITDDIARQRFHSSSSAGSAVRS